MSIIEEYAENYLDYMAYTHKSATTISVRRRHLKYFFVWCNEKALKSAFESEKVVRQPYGCGTCTGRRAYFFVSDWTC